MSSALLMSRFVAQEVIVERGGIKRNDTRMGGTLTTSVSLLILLKTENDTEKLERLGVLVGVRTML